jgi:hypothetical protein
MKRWLILCVALLSMAQAAESEKKGFLTSKWCAENGYFADCRLESMVCGSGDCFKEWEYDKPIKDELVLFVHDENKAYSIDYTAIPRYKLDEPMNRNGVTIVGELKGDILVVKSFKAPPPPTKSFFKGCL